MLIQPIFDGARRVVLVIGRGVDVRRGIDVRRGVYILFRIQLLGRPLELRVDFSGFPEVVACE